MNANYRVLVVDDEPDVRETVAELLTSEGYKVSTAEGGFDALLQLRREIPNLVVSDLNMPKMSGFELLSVIRRRFPQITVLAMSGAYVSGDQVPSGVLADGFYSKAHFRPKELLQNVAELLRSAGTREANHRQQSAPVWIPRNGKDSRGVPYVVLTCTECLRSFPLSVLVEGVPDVQVTPCLFCSTPVRYIVDFSLSVSSPRHDIIAE